MTMVLTLTTTWCAISSSSVATERHICPCPCLRETYRLRYIINCNQGSMHACVYDCVCMIAFCVCVCVCVCVRACAHVYAHVYATVCMCDFMCAYMLVTACLHVHETTYVYAGFLWLNPGNCNPRTQVYCRWRLVFIYFWHRPMTAHFCLKNCIMEPLRVSGKLVSHDDDNTTLWPYFLYKYGTVNCSGCHVILTYNSLAPGWAW